MQPVEAMIVNYPNRTEFQKSPKLNPDFVSRVEALRKNRRNSMVIFEDLGSFHSVQIQELANLLKGWKVQVLVAYRPLYSWLASVQNQVNRGLLNLKNWPKFQLHQPFYLDFDEFTTSQMFNAIAKYRKHPAELVRDKYAVYFENVQMIPLHQLPRKWGEGDPLLGYIFCHQLAELTPHTCQSIEKGLIGNNANVNPSEPLVYSLIADKAYRKGLIPRTSNRLSVIGRIKNEFEERNLTKRDLAMRCISNETVARLEHLSLEVEKRLFPDNWTAEIHNAGFKKFIERQEHCHVDQAIILKKGKDDEWRSFFQKGKDTRPVFFLHVRECVCIVEHLTS
jgi:hypothetical protein